MKAEGVKPGVLDVFLPYPILRSDTYLYCGLYIEFKKPSQQPKREGSKGGISEEQAMFIHYVKSVGYAVEVCYSWQDAVEAIKEYLKLDSQGNV